MDDLTWEFKLRRGVKFHDGGDFTAQDVVFSIDRVPNVPNSPSSFATYTKQITEKIIVDPYTIRFKTAAPYPLMPNDMSTIFMLSSRAAKGAATEDFNSGKATIGTGPSNSYALPRATASNSRAMTRIGARRRPGTK